ncbi:glutathione-regulated potassium-efflux system protein KefC [Undibacterium sp. Jales W-56]|uniref:glutathione-regulated potassium-efflux system protein KefC n=1 Tax=Undibacterium sp. Jales W-56 TaxID=2897325 RepID=UPI0021CEF848|nr:glutathione-regulated potassium-efflux system protein KefC [Undibacterium sp. Jales W-56]MCU6433946.1 glutathione-regulated potassium-efflux system protein KefC [Undibacterium sp. Jales W-56]
MDNTLLLNALIYLLAAVIAVPVAKRLGLGAVLGYLLAGMAIGPWGLRLIEDVQVILHFSEFGVVLLLFVIGLELEPKRLWSMRRPIFGWGGAQVLGCTVALSLVGIAFGAGWKTSLIAALGLSLSSTAIALATLDERNLMATPAGSASFSILLFQDIAAIPMIALIPLLGVAESQGDTEGWLAGLKVVGVIAALIVGGRYLIRPILRIIAKTEMREIFTAFALLLVISIALLMESVNMSMALGTFLAGVLLAESEYRHALESDLEPFKGLLLGLFFIAVGMSVDFGLFLTKPLQILGIVLLFLLVKMSVLYLLSRRFSIPKAQRSLFTFLLAQGGEFAFVVFATATGAKVFSAETSALLVVVVALSMVATPLLLVIYDKWLEPRLRNLEKPPEDEITSQDNPVIIAGFGRFGQIVGRLLYANRIRSTVLDHDPDQIEMLRKFGFKIFYGDATRADLLHAAGAGKAKILVIAIDDVEDSLALVDIAKEHFPHLTIVARARNITHCYQLMDRGVSIFERETFESSLQTGRQVLQLLGFRAYQARLSALRFRDHNIKTMHAVYPHYKDQQQMVSLSKQARDELEEMFARDREAREVAHKNGWDAS